MNLINECREIARMMLSHYTQLRILYRATLRKLQQNNLSYQFQVLRIILQPLVISVERRCHVESNTFQVVVPFCFVHISSSPLISK